MKEHVPGPWEYVPSTEHHGPYVCGPSGGDICDCYTMSNPSSWSARNGGSSKPVHFFGEMADANARLIAVAPEMLQLLKWLDRLGGLGHDKHERIREIVAKAEGLALTEG